jgi:hypothetical protein
MVENHVKVVYNSTSRIMSRLYMLVALVLEIPVNFTKVAQSFGNK